MRLASASEVTALLVNVVQHLVGQQQHRTSPSDNGTEQVEQKQLYNGTSTAAEIHNGTAMRRNWQPNVASQQNE